jgi:hypothetical protein
MAKKLNGKESGGRISFQLNQTNHNQKHYQRDHIVSETRNEHMNKQTKANQPTRGDKSWWIFVPG